MAEAQKTAIGKIKLGMKGFEADRLARKALQRAGLERFFSHSLGHGVGLEVHEAPRLSPRSRETLSENMAFTVEPGVYLPGRWGVRIEDTVILRGEGVEVLTAGCPGGENY